MSSPLSEIEQDALTELANIAVSGAASRLAKMVGSEVTLTVPVVTILRSADAGPTLASLGLATVTSVHQAFTGKLSGETILVFPEGDSDILVRAILGGDVPEAEQAALADDTVAEVGNVLLMGFLASIGSMLTLTFEVGLPVVRTTEAASLIASDEASVVLFVYVNFNIRGVDARGYFAFVLGLGSFAVLREILAAYIAEILD